MGPDRRICAGAGNESCHCRCNGGGEEGKEEGKKKIILFDWSGHGYLDMSSYDAYFSGKLEPYELPEKEIHRALKAIEGFPKP